MPSLLPGLPKCCRMVNFLPVVWTENSTPLPYLPPLAVKPKSVVPLCTSVPWSGVAPLPPGHVGKPLLGQVKLCRTLNLVLHFPLVLQVIEKENTAPTAAEPPDCVMP